MNFGDPIPGETPIGDASGLKIRGIFSRSQLNAAEAANILLASEKYLASRPNRRLARFDFSWAMHLHKEMFGRVWGWAGRARTEDLNIGVPYRQIEPRLFTMLGNLDFWSEMPIVEQAARLHHEAVFIHPFKNGNGRWSRMLANIWQMRHSSNYTAWPEESVGDASLIRDEYLQAIRAADCGEFEKLIELHARYTK